MLERILPDHKAVRGFEIEQDFPVIGHRVLVISARQLEGVQQILLGIDDVTERQQRADASSARKRAALSKGWLTQPR